MKNNLFAAMLAVVIVAATVPALPVAIAAGTAAPETRCGWFSNPTPANAWLTDAQGEWLIGAQGGYQAEGDWPEFKDSQWVKTNVNYGYGCACMKVNVNKSEEKVINIISASAKPLSACRKDKALKGKEPRD